MHARLPLDYDERRDYAIRFRSSQDGDWEVVPRVREAGERPDGGIAGLGEAGRAAGGAARDAGGDPLVWRERADDQPDSGGSEGGLMARDVKEHDQDLDGFRRNVREYIDDAEGVIDHVRAENAKGSHDPAMNALTEAARKDPKWAMHTVVIVAVAALAIGGIIVAIVALN